MPFQNLFWALKSKIGKWLPTPGDPVLVLKIDQVNHTRVVGGQPFVRLFARSVPAGTFTERTACLPASRFAAVQKGLMSDTERVVGRRGEGVREGGGRYMEVMRGEGDEPPGALVAPAAATLAAWGKRANGSACARAAAAEQKS